MNSLSLRAKVIRLWLRLSPYQRGQNGVSLRVLGGMSLSGGGALRGVTPLECLDAWVNAFHRPREGLAEPQTTNRRKCWRSLNFAGTTWIRALWASSLDYWNAFFNLDWDLSFFVVCRSSLNRSISKPAQFKQNSRTISFFTIRRSQPERKLVRI